jgi:hypothetical protein
MLATDSTSGFMSRTDESSFLGAGKKKIATTYSIPNLREARCRFVDDPSPMFFVVRWRTRQTCFTSLVSRISKNPKTEFDNHLDQQSP